MFVTFYGAVREVTGSMHLLSTETDRILLDCGMFQGRRKESERKNRVFPFNPKIITNLLLSHAHIDHSGRIPMLTRENFYGRVICTRTTADACEYLLSDSAHIQESDADYLNYKTLRSTLSRLRNFPDSENMTHSEVNKIKAILKKDRHQLNVETINKLIADYGLKEVRPLYTVEHAMQSLTYFDGYPYRYPITIGNQMTCTFYEAAHIAGSALSVIRASEEGQRYTVCYTGDIGRFDKPILKNPASDFNPEDQNIDLLIMESTYGNRIHEPVQDLKSRLKDILTETVYRGGTLLIPSFAYGRTQELIYLLHELYDDNEVPRVPIYVDSPLAINLTRVFGEHPEVYDQDVHETFLKQGKNPFVFNYIHFTPSVEESMALMQEEKPHIVIASSGMCEGGRILHHLRYKIHNPQNTILIVGYMAENTLGRRILDKGEEYEAAGQKGDPPMLRFLNKDYPLKAHVLRLGGFSAHADKHEMLRFLKESNLKIRRIAIVHGEEEQSLLFASYLKNEGFSVIVPQPGQTISVR